MSRNCAEPWARPSKVHTSDDQPEAVHGVAYRVGMLVVVVLEVGRVLLARIDGTERGAYRLELWT